MEIQELFNLKPNTDIRIGEKALHVLYNGTNDPPTPTNFFVVENERENLCVSESLEEAIKELIS